MEPVETGFENRMKILRIIARLNVGGPARHVTWLAGGLLEYGYSTVLVYGKVEANEESMEGLVLQQSIPSYCLSSLSRSIHPVKDLLVVWDLFGMMRKVQPDIIHTHTSKAGFCGRLAGAMYRLVTKKKIQIVHTYHGHTFHGYFSRFTHFVFLIIERFLADFCTDKIVTLSDRQKNEIMETYKVGKPEQHYIVPLGLNFNFTKELDRLALRNKFQVSKGEFVFAIVGRVAPIKNHRLFIEAAMIFMRTNPGKPVRFAIIGGGESKILDDLMGLEARIELGENLLFCGNQEEPAQIYGFMDCLVLTSVNEGTPLSILEAFAASVPVVSTAVGGVPDTLGEGVRGLLVEQNPSSVAQGMQEVFEKDNSSRTQLAREYVIQNFSLENLYSRIDGIYRSEL